MRRCGNSHSRRADHRPGLRRHRSASEVRWQAGWARRTCRYGLSGLGLTRVNGVRQRNGNPCVTVFLSRWNSARLARSPSSSPGASTSSTYNGELRPQREPSSTGTGSAVPTNLPCGPRRLCRRTVVHCVLRTMFVHCVLRTTFVHCVLRTTFVHCVLRTRVVVGVACGGRLTGGGGGGRHRTDGQRRRRHRRRVGRAAADVSTATTNEPNPTCGVLMSKASTMSR